MLQSMPRDVRKLLVNVAGTQSFVMEVEVLRGDLLDVVELKTGDQFGGMSAISPSSWSTPATPRPSTESTPYLGPPSVIGRSS